MSTLGVNCLLPMQKESSDMRHFLLAGIGKRTVSPKVLLVAKSKTMLFLNVRAFIPSVKMDFATRIQSGHQPIHSTNNHNAKDAFRFNPLSLLLRDH